MLKTNDNFQQKNRFNATPRILLGLTVATVLFHSYLSSEAQAASRQTKQTEASTEAKLIDDYIKSKGYTSKIVFDSSNIKQFWIDNSISSQDDSICIVLPQKDSNGFYSVPLKIQLANVSETLDCKVEIIADTPNTSFSVTNSKHEMLSMSSDDEPFIQYHTASSSFHLEDTPDQSFSLNFASKTQEFISVKKIILSFSNNQNPTFRSSPGSLKITRDITTVSGAVLNEGNDIRMTGKRSKIVAQKNLIISDKTVETSVKIKNTGDKATRIYVGFLPFSEKRVQLYPNNYPFDSSCGVLKVVSSKADSNTIIVDSYSNWAKNSFLALNAEEDCSDVPNTSFVDGQIVEVKKLPNGQAEITMDKPLKTALETGTKVRIHGLIGSYIYTNREILQPGEEKVFVSSIKKDDKLFQFSAQSFPKGIYYVQPVILSYSIENNEENTVLISDYTVCF